MALVQALHGTLEPPSHAKEIRLLVAFNYIQIERCRDFVASALGLRTCSDWLVRFDVLALLSLPERKLLNITSSSVPAKLSKSFQSHKLTPVIESLLQWRLNQLPA
jgi:hypothetical protein